MEVYETWVQDQRQPRQQPNRAMAPRRDKRNLASREASRGSRFNLLTELAQMEQDNGHLALGQDTTPDIAAPPQPNKLQRLLRKTHTWASYTSSKSRALLVPTPPMTKAKEPMQPTPRPSPPTAHMSAQVIYPTQTTSQVLHSTQDTSSSKPPKKLLTPLTSSSKLNEVDPSTLATSSSMQPQPTSPNHFAISIPTHATIIINDHTLFDAMQEDENCRDSEKQIRMFSCPPTRHLHRILIYYFMPVLYI
ncbi:hypothetical protein K2173_021334 [Erythroxylum novogranatense]|uniref:Uncharacterized protein n=1 Tax=Erythroxylum novogranatense TaxID=1862640 RepID=A0AAV8TUY0_9ROSI|nr:hypothetical protein K2173_021334 [Erythroxylum novogranatense]